METRIDHPHKRQYSLAMNRKKELLLACTLVLGMASALAQAPASAPANTPPNVKVRGAVTGFDGRELQVKSREGKALKLVVSDSTRISVLSPLKMSDIKQGGFVGVTAILRGGTLQALEVHVFPESLRGTGEGHYDWDLEPGSSMTNANVDAIVSTNTGEELTLSYKGGSQKIVVPKGVPIVTFTPGDKSLLKPGAKVFIVTEQAADGSLTALRMAVGKDGMKPPM